MDTEKRLGGLQWSLPREQDWEFMGANTPIKTILFPSGDHTKYLPAGERQATKYFDPWCCVSESFENCISTVLDRLMEIDPTIRPILASLDMLDDDGRTNISARALAVMSGTKPGVGNSQINVAETARKCGLVGEKVWPSSPDMQESEWYQAVPQNVLDKAKEFLKFFDIFHENVKSDFMLGISSNADIAVARKYGGVQVCVVGSYQFDQNGIIVKVPSTVFNHAVQHYDDEPTFHDIFDSYDPFNKKFETNYGFGTAKLIYVKKKTMFQLVKTANSNSVFLYVASLNGYFGIATTVINNLTVHGGDWFLAFCGKFENAGIKIIDSIPPDRILGDIKPQLFTK